MLYDLFYKTIIFLYKNNTSNIICTMQSIIRHEQNYTYVLKEIQVSNTGALDKNK